MTRTSPAGRPAVRPTSMLGSVLVRALSLSLLGGLFAMLPVAFTVATAPLAAADPVPSTVSLAVDNVEFATYETSTLTATLDVALSGESLVIWDVTNGSVVKTCAWGTTCAQAVSWQSGGPGKPAGDHDARVVGSADEEHHQGRRAHGRR